MTPSLWKQSSRKASYTHPKGYNKCSLDSNATSYKKGTFLLMADSLSRVYLSLKEATEEDVVAVSETRSPTEIEAEQVNMLQYLPVKDETLCQIQNLIQEDAIVQTLARVIT